LPSYPPPQPSPSRGEGVGDAGLHGRHSALAAGRCAPCRQTPGLAAGQCAVAAGHCTVAAGHCTVAAGRCALAAQVGLRYHRRPTTPKAPFSSLRGLTATVVMFTSPRWGEVGAQRVERDASRVRGALDSREPPHPTSPLLGRPLPNASRACPTCAR
jgi:hypothetical protein